MSGRNRRVLLNNKDIGQPNTLTMDYKRKRLCWTDYKYLHVACMKLDGKKNIEIISRQVCYLNILTALNFQIKLFETH